MHAAEGWACLLQSTPLPAPAPRHHRSAGAIAGIIVGVLAALLVAAAAAAFVLYRAHRRRKSGSSIEMQDSSLGKSRYQAFQVGGHACLMCALAPAMGLVMGMGMLLRLQEQEHGAANGH
jgi:hypothetical protein